MLANFQASLAILTKIFKIQINWREISQNLDMNFFNNFSKGFDLTYITYFEVKFGTLGIQFSNNLVIMQF